jgi:serine/threonine-protein kinase
MRSMLGRGGMGEVWLAHDVRIDREVAIKLMRGDSASDPDAVARFLREARVQGRLAHPAIVPVHDLGSDPGAPYFAMKRLTGTTLADVLAAHARGDAEALAQWTRRALLARFVDVCLAIELAHRHGVIHRDLKPANIMLGDFGETYVLDWGLARVGEATDAIRASDLGASDESGHTSAGAMLGTPGYMAPEQMRGEPVDHRSDVYALGCILFEILVGEPAVARNEPYESTLGTLQHRPSSRRIDVEIGPELDDLCARATAAEPDRRASSARELADAIQKFLDGDRDLARRRELADGHVERAKQAFAQGDAAGRAEAMREGGRAIALDPENQAAKALLARLLLEPPREVPAEVQAEVARERDVAGRGILRKGSIAYIANLLMLVALKLIGIAGTWPFALIGVLLILMIAGCYYGALRARPLGPGETIALVMVHVVLIASAGVVLGPFVIAPLFALGSVYAMVTYPGVRMPRFVVVSHMLSILVPFALELVGALPRTFEVSSDRLVLHPRAIDVPGPVLVGLALVTPLLLMVINGAIAASQRAAQEAAEERVQVTSWHLRQLVR